jgi:hypothetical protein
LKCVCPPKGCDSECRQKHLGHVLHVGRRGETVRHELSPFQVVWFSIVGDVGELLELPWDFESKGLRGFEIDD